MRGMDVRIDETGTLIVEFDTGLRCRKRRKQMYMQLRKAGVKHKPAEITAKYLSQKTNFPYGKFVTHIATLSEDCFGRKTIADSRSKNENHS